MNTMLRTTTSDDATSGDTAAPDSRSSTMVPMSSQDDAFSGGDAAPDSSSPSAAAGMSPVGQTTRVAALRPTALGEQTCAARAAVPAPSAALLSPGVVGARSHTESSMWTMSTAPSSVFASMEVGGGGPPVAPSPTQALAGVRPDAPLRPPTGDQLAAGTSPGPSPPAAASLETSACMGRSPAHASVGDAMM